MRARGIRVPRRGVLASRALVAAAGAGLLAGAAVALPGTAHAAPVAATHLSHPERDWAGSTVAAHEGRAAVPPGSAPQAATTKGLDVSSRQGSVNWTAARKAGARFAYVKATESTTYHNAHFTQQYNGSYKAGLIRGAYHFATPNTSTGRAQADYFVKHGGGWSKDGRTLPPILDIEYNPYGAECYGKSHAAMVAWVKSFTGEVHARTGRWPTIYTTADWWNTCTGKSPAFAAKDPLFVARYSARIGALPAGWRTWTVWQYADSGALPGDQDRFNGGPARIKALANNT
ncbi:lysozyme [Streptomyces sp. SL13]|uniref:Lysozyme n=1 Tax=Streptantibioticus silvisoli TaxID=2705255 RepID=A0AA90GWL0_9ACTN|nr:lysozyme [Streptantibioticus silvisoli]MDI5969219.1 lysozyme [Streptantibioticus silvisoli]